MSSLPTLVKLTKVRVDEQRQLLAKLHARLDQLEQDIATIHEKQELERLIVANNPETALTYGEFVQWAMKQERELVKQRETANAAVTIARDKLAELYAEQKRYELAAASAEDAARREEQKRDMQDMDEISTTNFTRRKKDTDL